MRENAAAKARRILCEGRLIVRLADINRVRAICRGDGHLWRQSFEFGTWTCDCPCRTDQCSHLRALRLVTAPDLKENR